MTVTFDSFPNNVNLDPYKNAFLQAKVIVTKAAQSAQSVKTMYQSSDAYKDVAKAYQRFWGGNDSSTVATRLTTLKSAFIMKDLKIIFSTGVASVTAKAFVYNVDKATAPGGAYTGELYFCKPLISGYASMGTNSAAGTIVHEMSHLVLATVDKKYGMKSCSELSDADKIVNADNFKYYCELFQLARLSLMPELSDAYDMSHSPPR